MACHNFTNSLKLSKKIKFDVILTTSFKIQDEDGVLTFPELSVVMKSLGQRPNGNNIFVKFCTN